MRRVKAEWERQNAVLLAYPHKNSDWNEDLETAKIPFFKMAQAIAYSQMVYLLCDDINEAKKDFCSTTNIIFIEAKYNDTWIRDYGPISADENGKNILLDFKFNGWGGKFEASLDNKVTKFLHSKGFFGATPLLSYDFELEGGAIESDGSGTILTTKSCLLNPNRNGGLNQTEAERALKKYLGANRVLWIENSYLEGDDTDGHIDMLARFISKDTIAYIKCEDSQDNHYKSLLEMERELKSFKTSEGKAYNLIPLPFPQPKYKDANRLPASYANFLITNKAIIAPTYQDEQDKIALETLKELFPTREVIPIPSLKLIEQGGSVHCSSMQVSF